MRVPSEDVKTILTAGCKVNLSLTVTGRRDDGYHTLDSLFWPLPEPADTLTVTRAPGNGLAFSCSDKALETQDNILVKAYDAFARATGFSPGLSVHLEKKIPYGAGLGGGSSDAAALLLYLARLAADENTHAADRAFLETMGARLGADVPFFFRNEPSQVRGIGDVLAPVPPETLGSIRGFHLVLVCPKIHVATAWAFRAWDEKHPANALTNGDGNDSSPLVRGIRIRNDLCGVVFERYPAIGKILARMRDLGADAASMSGTGSAVFGLFRVQSDAANALRFFHDSGERVYHHTL